MKTDYAQLANVDEFRAYLAKLPAKAPISIWLNIELGDREAEGFGSRIASIEVSSKAGEGRSIWMDEKGEALAALMPVLEDAKRPKIVHDPKLIELLAGPVAGIRHRPTDVHNLHHARNAPERSPDFGAEDGRRRARDLLVPPAKPPLLCIQNFDSDTPRHACTSR